MKVKIEIVVDLPDTHCDEDIVREAFHQGMKVASQVTPIFLLNGLAEIQSCLHLRRDSFTVRPFTPLEELANQAE